MSSTANADENVCANCGIECREEHRKQHEKDCKNFRLRYLVTAISEAWNVEQAAEMRDEMLLCSDGCRELHLPEHVGECRKREKELHDRKLFTQPDRTDECPICFLPLPIDPQQFTFKPCCSAEICKGCVHANYNSNGNYNCPFCREPQPKKAEVKKRVMKRVKANDPAAFLKMGTIRYDEGDCNRAIEYFRKAAKLGDADAHYNLGLMYRRGEGVEEDLEKGIQHWEKAAIGGHPYSRHNLAIIEESNENVERAVKHYIIAANLGEEKSMKALWKHYSAGNITKEDLDATLRTHQAALEGMKSEQRNYADYMQQKYGMN